MSADRPVLVSAACDALLTCLVRGEVAWCRGTTWNLRTRAAAQRLVDAKLARIIDLDDDHYVVIGPNAEWDFANQTVRAEQPQQRPVVGGLMPVSTRAALDAFIALASAHFAAAQSAPTKDFADAAGTLHAAYASRAVLPQLVDAIAEERRLAEAFGSDPDAEARWPAAHERVTELLAQAQPKVSS